jgi:carboxylesterase
MTLVPAPVETTTAVVLLHGLNSTPEEFVFMQAVLKRHHYAVFALTIPGFSYQPQGPKTSDVSFEKWLAHLQKQVEDIKSQHDKVVMVGISAGANLVLAMGLVAGHCVDALVLMSQTLFLDGWKIPWYAKLLPILLYTPLGYFYTYRETSPYGVKDERIRAWIEKEIHKNQVSASGALEIGVDSLRENHRLQRWLLQRLRSQSLKLPTLSLHAQHDEIASLANQVFVARHVEAAVFSSVVYKNSYHMLTIDRDRYALFQDVIEFLKRLEVHRLY